MTVIKRIIAIKIIIMLKYDDISHQRGTGLICLNERVGGDSQRQLLQRSLFAD